MRTIVEVNGLEKSYGSAKVLSHCSLRIHEGEVYGLPGVNEAGIVPDGMILVMLGLCLVLAGAAGVAWHVLAGRIDVMEV